MPEEQEYQKPIGSARTFEEWKIALISLVSKNDPTKRIIIENEKVRPYYDQGLQPTVCFNELFNN